MTFFSNTLSNAFKLANNLIHYLIPNTPNTQSRPSNTQSHQSTLYSAETSSSETCSYSDNQKQTSKITLLKQKRCNNTNSSSYEEVGFNSQTSDSGKTK